MCADNPRSVTRDHAEVSACRSQLRQSRLTEACNITNRTVAPFVHHNNRWDFSSYVGARVALRHRFRTNPLYKDTTLTNVPAYGDCLVHTFGEAYLQFTGQGGRWRYTREDDDLVFEMRFQVARGAIDLFIDENAAGPEMQWHRDWETRVHEALGIRVSNLACTCLDDSDQTCLVCDPVKHVSDFLTTVVSQYHYETFDGPLNFGRIACYLWDVKVAVVLVTTAGDLSAPPIYQMGNPHAKLTVQPLLYGKNGHFDLVKNFPVENEGVPRNATRR